MNYPARIFGCILSYCEICRSMVSSGKKPTETLYLSHVFAEPVRKALTSLAKLVFESNSIVCPDLLMFQECLSGGRPVSVSSSDGKITISCAKDSKLIELISKDNKIIDRYTKFVSDYLSEFHED